MGRLVYSYNISLDGYVADRHGRFDWSAPDAHVHSFINELVKPATTHLYGRRMYDVMDVWDTLDEDEPEIRDFAESWRAADKIVYSRTLTEPRTGKTRIVAAFDPEQLRSEIAEADHDFLIGGADLAGQAIAAGLVDDIHSFISPVMVGGGTAFLPGGVRLDLELAGQDRFANGVVHLHHRVRH